MGASGTPPQFDESRRSSFRLPLSVPIVLSGVDESGRSFTEKTVTVVINRRGAKVLAKQPLPMGAKLELTIPQQNRSSPATVVWLGAKKGAKQEVGLALILNQTEDFWGVDFPGDASSLHRAGPATETKADKQEAPENHAALTAHLGRQGGLAAPASKPEVLPVGVDAFEKLSGIVQDLVQQAVQESLKDALSKLNQQVEESLDRALGDVTEQAQGHLDQAVRAALEQLQVQAMEHMGRVQLDYEQTLQELAQVAEEQMRARLAEYEAHLAASAENVRRQLADKLANLSASLLQG
ncbi:MAG: hypothetical protein HYS38_02230 [Acidobacteria bacterium]|nr:hypothetical protein [Acidobacteriota bacterium]